MISYTIRDTDIILDVEHQISQHKSDRKYVLKVRDLPAEDKPRERLLAVGPSGLSSQELLAIVLTSGTKKEGVLEMSGRVLKEYGERVLSKQTNPLQLAKDLGIPLLKATQIVACAELGKRFFQENPSSAPTIRTARDVFDYLQDMRALPREHMRGIYLNAHHKVIHDEVISIGTVNSSIIHPREVFKPGIEYNAAAVILAHNHPSGVVTPSPSDIETTNQLIAAGKIIGIPLIDHVIVTKDSFISIDTNYNE
jgi:DNA repair protein RadC